MNHATLPALVLLAGVVSTLDAAAPPVPGGDLTFRTTFPLKTPRSRDPVLGGPRDRVYFQVWIPAEVAVVRGAVCNPFSKDEAVSQHWKAACRHWRFAYVQTDFDAVRKEEFGLLAKALTELATTSRHPELALLPLCFTGMSRGGGMSVQLAELMPARTIAAVPVCLEVGPTAETTRHVPMLTVFGEKDGRQMEQLLGKLPGARSQGAVWAIAVQWNRRHEFGQANNLSFVFLDEVIRARLPGEVVAGRPVRLADLAPAAGWLGDPGDWGKDGRRPTIASWAAYEGERGRACWLPSQRVAAVWQSFVAGSAEVRLEPAGLGDGQAFRLHPPGHPVAVKVSLAEALKPTRVELWDGDRRLGERTGGPWQFEVALAPGIHGLYAVAHQEGRAARTSRPHAVVVGE